jgi:hypothetical protein
MADALALNLTEKDLYTSIIAVGIGYDIASAEVEGFSGELVTDWYGMLYRKVFPAVLI